MTVNGGESGGRSRAQTEELSLLDRAERIGGLGSWDWRPKTGELLWSDNHFRLFGLEPGSITPSVELVLAYMHPADVERVAATLAHLEASGDMATFEYRIVRNDDVVRDLRAAVSLVEDEGGQQRIVGSVQDVTDERRLARELAARGASRALDEWQDFQQGALALLSGLATAMDLTFAVLWIPQHASLTAKLIWHPDGGSLAHLAAATRAWSPGRGSATLGRAWESRRPVASNDATAAATPQRAAAMRDAGMQAAIAVPAVADDATVAVLELLCVERIEPTDRLLRALRGIGHQVGYFLGQRRGELVDDVLTPREREVLQLAARALSAASIAEQMKISPATVKRHFEDAYARLGVNDRAAAVAAAMRLGLIT